MDNDFDYYYYSYERKDYDLLGEAAEIGGICTGRSYTAQEDSGSVHETAWTVIHELGHKSVYNIMEIERIKII